MGRARAWLRMALMQKKLADYLKVLIDHKEDILSEYFEPDALMMSEEAIVIMGLLVGLNVIDCNFCVKVSPPILCKLFVTNKNGIELNVAIGGRPRLSTRGDRFFIVSAEQQSYTWWIPRRRAGKWQHDHRARSEKLHRGAEPTFEVTICTHTCTHTRIHTRHTRRWFEAFVSSSISARLWPTFKLKWNHWQRRTLLWRRISLSLKIIYCPFTRRIDNWRKS